VSIPTSVAVLSFQSRSRDTADIFLAEGLADDIASRLGQIARLTVRSREAVRRIRNADSLTVGQLGQTLNATYVLSGALRPMGTRLRLVFELTRAQTGGVAWTRPFDAPREQLLDVQAAVSEAVARAVLGSLAPAERSALVSGSTQSEAAFAHIARGTPFLARRLLLPAMAEFRAAVRDDSMSAAAWARLAHASALCIDWGQCAAASDTIRARTRLAARRALALDSTLAYAWLADATVWAIEGDNPRAVASHRRAEQLDPRDADVLHGLGVSLFYVGADEEAVRALRRAVALDPGRAISYYALGNVAYRQGNYGDAIAMYDTAMTLQPDMDFRDDQWRSILALGDTSAIHGAWARLAAGRGEAVTGNWHRWIEDGFVALVAGDTARANRAADSLTAPAAGDDLIGALFLVRLGRHREARALIADRLARKGEWSELRSPALAGLDALPEFRSYVEKARREATTSPK
jgi:serine/threonine-protein kinase